MRAEEKPPAAEQPGADPTATRKRFVEDAALVLLAVLILIVPAWLRSMPDGPVRVEARRSTPVRIDINGAPWYEWTLLDGIGEARARGIVEYRDANGPFQSIEDLKKVPRMPAGWVDKAGSCLEVGSR